ncbi:MAG TPA: T9SS type A sorting domain-containing protein [bacterium]|nr:T9SS type A sorting domain-containing protein [bacterium]HQJ66346.1 T9SS type A sorting domain-containing protein [bacterium]
MKKLIFNFIFLFGSCLMAQDFSVFTNLGGDKKWDNPANWSTNRVPGANDEVYIPGDKGVLLDKYCKAKKITIEGSVATGWVFGSEIFTDQLIIKKTGDILMRGDLKILPVTNQLNVENEGKIWTDMYSQPKRLSVGEQLYSKNVTMNIPGGKIQNAQFQFSGSVLEMSGAFIAGHSHNINADFVTMSKESVLSSTEGKTVEESSPQIVCHKRMLLDKGSRIICDQDPKSVTGGNINIFADTFINYGALRPGKGFKTNGKVNLCARNLFNQGAMGGGSGTSMGKRSAIQQNEFSNITLSADSVVIAQQDSMIIADTLKIFGKNIKVAIQNQAGIALLNGIEFYTTADGTVDFTQTTIMNAIAGGYSKHIFSNHVIPSEKWKLQRIFMSDVTILPADTTQSNASATLTNGFGFANAIGTLRLFLQNLSMAAQSIKYEIDSELGWVGAITGNTAELAPFSADSVQIPFHIPPETIRGIEDIVRVRISINGVEIDTTYATITCLSRSTHPGELNSISVSPAAANLTLGGKQLFTAVGFTADGDTLHYFRPVWSATGGEINAAGLYTATQTGNWIVTCTDSSTGVTTNASVNVGATLVESDNESAPTKFALQQNYPNPFNATTKIKFSIPTSPFDSFSRADGIFINLIVYDILGNEVMTLVNGYKPAGTYEVEFDASHLPSGVYYYKLKVGEYLDIKKMVLIK